jgi:hypothetical protein
VGRPSGTKALKSHSPGALRSELERHIEEGACVYCRAPARPDSPLTREHVIPRARGGRRNDVRIIVPACARCNQHRGCAELIPFLLARPQRVSAFLDYLSTLSPESIRELDPRILAELYVAVAIIGESAAHGMLWRREMERLCSGRSLHRRRYATRRALLLVSDRIASFRETSRSSSAPTCVIPLARPEVVPLHLDEPLERLASRMLGVLALLWQVPAEFATRELTRQLGGSAIDADPFERPQESELSRGVTDDGVVELDGWKRPPKRKRLRVDRRQGRGTRARGSSPARGRAA